ncbi:MAG: GFA family protein [Litoreibacter sp.]
MTSRSIAHCHCGTVRLSFVMLGGIAGGGRCDCSLCRRKNGGAVTAAVSDLKIEKGEDVLRLYQFGTETARHWFCSECGIHTHHQRRSDPSEMGVNLGCVDGVPARVFDQLEWVDGVNHPSDAQ